MSVLLHGCRAVVTGAASGIGLSIATRLSEEGAAVVLADIDGTAVTSVTNSMPAFLSDRAHAATVDVQDEDSVAALVTRSVDLLGGVDVVVANAGVLHLSNVIDTTLRDWERVLRTNLTGAFLTCRAFGQLMVKQGRGGRIVLTSSLFGVRGGRENAAYSASKFGVVGLAQSLAAELAPYGILVNSVCPGQVSTPMMRRLFADRASLTGGDQAAVETDLRQRIPLGRMAEPEEIADVFVFLASSLSRYMTGQALVVDGGWQVN